MAKKPIDKMTANELFKLAKRREQQEQKKALAEKQAELVALKAERKRLITEHTKALRAIDKSIAAITGRKKTTRKTKATAKASTTGRKRGSLTAAIVKVLSSSDSVSISDLRASLSSKGIASKNLNQQLAYLKRKGQITSPSRGHYAIA